PAAEELFHGTRPAVSPMPALAKRQFIQGAVDPVVLRVKDGRSVVEPQVVNVRGRLPKSTVARGRGRIHGPRPRKRTEIGEASRKTLLHFPLQGVVVGRSGVLKEVKE